MARKCKRKKLLTHFFRQTTLNSIFYTHAKPRDLSIFGYFVHYRLEVSTIPLKDLPNHRVFQKFILLPCLYSNLIRIICLTPNPNLPSIPTIIINYSFSNLGPNFIDFQHLFFSDLCEIIFSFQPLSTFFPFFQHVTSPKSSTFVPNPLFYIRSQSPCDFLQNSIFQFLVKFIFG